jgi:hypothetical protein
MQVKVYFNLHKKVWSVLAKSEKGWRLWKHSPRVLLSDVTWKVSEAGRQRVLRERRKNVHAFAIGTWLEQDHDVSAIPVMFPVEYNPYKGPYFTMLDKPVHSSPFAEFMQFRRVFACNSR